ncbi:MAG TPA: phytanoyl-CoA dioxygenase family protein [Puia sp.]
MSMQQVKEQGFCILGNVYSDEEIQRIVEKIGGADHIGPAFRKSSDLFAIRRFLHVVPDVRPVIFTPALQAIISSFGPDYFPVKSIYFDKPGSSNWFVSYHQDLTISVDKKVEYPGFSGWTVKQDRFSVQPPVDVLENIFTIRIHLDDTDEGNGALRVAPGSHLHGVVRPELTNLSGEQVCKVGRGGVMIMKPLLLHASGRTVDARNRRVIHIEFSNRALPGGLEWGERVFPNPENNPPKGYSGHP